MKKNRMFLIVVLVMIVGINLISGCGKHVSPTAIVAIDVPTPTPVYTETCNYSMTTFWGTGERCTGVNDPGIFLTPCGITVDNSGDLYTADVGNNRIVKYSFDGTQLAAWGSGGLNCSDPGTGDGQFNSPFGIDIDGSDNIYVLDSYNGRVQKFDSSFNYLLQWSFGSGICRGMAVDESGNVYVANTTANTITKYDQYGTQLLQWGAFGSGDGEFDGSTTVAVNKSGAFVYVTDTGNHRVQKFDSGGNYLTQWGGFVSVYGGGGSDFDWPMQCTPWGITVDGVGNVYVCDSENSMIKKYNENGIYLNSWTTAITPWAITVDSDGAVYAVGFASRYEKYTCQ